MTKRRVVTIALALALSVAARGTAATITVPAGADLQAAFDRAQPGDTILLQAGATYTGNFVLGNKPGAAFITVRSASTDTRLPPDGTRVHPGVSSALARIESPNAEAAIRTAPGAHHWRLLFLELRGGANASGDIVRLGDGSEGQSARDQVPHDLVVDRCYVHGEPNLAQKRGIALNSASTQILNSWIADIKAVGQDSQAIAGWNGPGPFTIVNNYLEAAGENVLFGGADAAIDGLVPTGITIKHNWIAKQLAWRGGPWQVKNLLELKNARGVVIEGNVLENNWQAAQPGYAILFTPRNQDGRSPWSTVQDVTVRGNVVRHVAAAFNILGHDSPQQSQQARDITITNNLVYDVSSSNWGGAGTFVQIGDGPANIAVEHNTVVQTGNIVTAYGEAATGFVFRNNIVLHNEYGVKGDSQAVGTATLATYFPAAVFTKNAIAGGSASQYPNGNLFPSVADFYAQFSDPQKGNFQLAASSSLLRAASDGSALGVDPRMPASTLAAALNNAQIAVPRGSVIFQKTRIGG